MLFDNIIYAVLAGIIGARILYFVLYRNQFSSFSEIFYLWNGGMVSYGGFVLGGLILLLLLFLQKKPVGKWFDITTIGFAFGLFLGRIGNLMAGEYAGKPSGSWLSIDGLIPVTLLEGIYVFLLAFSFLIIYRSQKIKDGLLALIFLFAYGSGRFIIDFWRDEKVRFFHISMGQWFSLLIAIISLIIIMLLLRKKELNVNN